jgi:phage baseplate assembly protein W
VPHLAFPLRSHGGRPAVVEQGTLDDVRQCVFTLMRTPRGCRPLAPETGVEDPTFSQGIDGDELAAELEAEHMEPRARVDVTADPVDETGRQRVRVEVSLVDDVDEIDEE